MGGIPAGGAGPPPPAGAKGTSSSAVKSIVAACSVVASCCSITASRHARRPSTSVPSSPNARSSRAAAQGVRLPIVVGVAALTHATQGTECLSQLAIEVNQVQKSSCTQPCCRLRCTRPPLRESKRQQQSARATRGLAGCNFSALQSPLKHALPWHNNATRPARSPAELQQRFTQEQHAVDAPYENNVARRIGDAVGGLGRPCADS